MQYYNEYLDKSLLNNINIKSGILTSIDNIFYVNNEEVINNRAIINDEVYILDNEIIGIKNRMMNHIVGILYLDSKVKYGNIKDKTLYLFKPTNKSYPNFYVPYKSGFKNNKIYVIIQFKEWNITDKLPIGTLIDIIGIVGDKNIEYEHLRNYYGIKNNTWKMDKNKLIEDTNIINNLQNIESDYEVFSIDPLGSKDIDDAFHFKKIENDIYEIGIHIALPYIFFENDLDTIMNRVSTVYLPDKKYNMLPNIYADDFSSLLENKNRYSLSLILKNNHFDIISYEIRKTIVKNIKNYDYDNFDKIYKKNKNLKEFVEYSKLFFKIDEFDSHKLVESWMIYTNKTIAKYLIEQNISNLILRVHIKSSLHNIKDNVEDNVKNISLINYLKIRNESSAIYKIYNKDEEQHHSKLGNEYYTHFTSPIRRAIDLFIHSLILKKSNIMNHEKLNEILNKINIFTKNTRKFDRNIRRLNFIYSIKELEKNIDTYGYIINITKNKLTIYMPEYNLEEKIIIIPKKFEKIANIILIKDNFDNIIEISYLLNNNEKEFKYNLYEKINIRLWVLTEFDNIFDKLKIEIL